MGRPKATPARDQRPDVAGPSDPDEFLTVSEFARIFRVSAMTVHRLVDRGEVRAVKLGDRVTRIPSTEVDRLRAGAA